MLDNSNSFFYVNDVQPRNVATELFAFPLTLLKTSKIRIRMPPNTHKKHRFTTRAEILNLMAIEK